MKICDYESAVVEAVKQSAWDERLLEHVRSCEACADLALIAQWLAEEGKSARVEAANALPSPGRIWWKAGILTRQDAAERATRPITYFRKMAYPFGLLSLAAVASWNWSSIQPWLRPLRMTWAQLSTAGTHPLLNPFLYLSVGFGFLVLLGAFALYVAWAEP